MSRVIRFLDINNLNTTIHNMYIEETHVRSFALLALRHRIIAVQAILLQDSLNHSQE